MTIDSLYFPERYRTHDGTRYPFTFEVIDPSYVEVFIGDPRVELVYNVDYTVELGRTRDPIFKAGVVVLNAAVSPGQQIDIERKTAITNDQVFLDEPFDTEAFEFSMDKLTMIAQELDGHLCDCRECLLPAVTVEVRVNGQLQSGLTVSPSFGQIEVQPGDVVELTGIVSAGRTPITYQWQESSTDPVTPPVDFTDIAGETGLVYTFTVDDNLSGFKNFRLLSTNECGTTASVVLLLNPALPECFPYECDAFDGRVTTPLYFGTQPGPGGLVIPTQRYTYSQPDDRYFNWVQSNNPPIDPCVGPATWVLEYNSAIDDGSVGRLIADSSSENVPSQQSLYIFRNRNSTGNTGTDSITWPSGGLSDAISHHEARWRAITTGSLVFDIETQATLLFRDIGFSDGLFNLRAQVGADNGGHPLAVNNDDVVDFAEYVIDNTVPAYSDWSLFYIESSMGSPTWEQFQLGGTGSNRYALRTVSTIRVVFITSILGEYVVNETSFSRPRYQGTFTQNVAGPITLTPIPDLTGDYRHWLMEDVNMQVGFVESFPVPLTLAEIEALWLAFRRNRVDYEPPDYCT